MFRRFPRLVLSALSLLLVFGLALFTILIAAPDNTGPTEAQYKEDFNGDGTVNIADVIALLLFQRANPGDLGSDYNGDGNPKYS